MSVRRELPSLLPLELSMIKLVMCLRRRPDKTREEFQRYWLEEHGPYFQAKASVMRAKKYVQSHTLDTPLNGQFRESRGMQPDYDGVAEVWFDSEEEMVAAMSTPEGQELAAALLEDEQGFIDHANSSAFLVEERAF